MSPFGPEQLAGRSSNSPYFGIELPGKIHTTVRHGYITYQNGHVTDEATVAEAAKRARALLETGKENH